MCRVSAPAFMPAPVEHLMVGGHIMVCQDVAWRR